MYVYVVNLLVYICFVSFFFFSSRRRHTRSLCDWSSDVCSSDLGASLSSCHPRQGIIQSRHAETGVLDVARFTPHVHAVDVDISQRFLEWVKRMRGVVFCAE